MKDASREVTDPCPIVCSACGREHHFDAGGTRCGNERCRAFLPTTTDEQQRLFAKRLEQTALADDGYVTVGGYIEGVHSDEQYAQLAIGSGGESA